MTRNQIAYHTLQETKRSNFENERLKGDQNQETRRSNVANERIKVGQLAETSRANKAHEAEAQRHNKQQEIHSYVDSGLNLIGNLATAGLSGALKNVGTRATNRSKELIASTPSIKVHYEGGNFNGTEQ